MQAIFDHITAILVGATLLGALVFIQMRQQQAAIETTIHDRSQQQAGSFFEVAQRELENARTRDQSKAGLGYYVMEVEGTPTRTDRFTFVTTDPPPPGASATPLNTVQAVSYVLVATGDSVRVGTGKRATYRVERWTNEVASGGTTAPGSFTFAGQLATDVVSFVVRAYDRTNTQRDWASTGAGYGRPASTESWADPVRFEIEIEAAARGPERRSSDQAATSTQNLVRLAHSVLPVNVGASGSSTVGGTAATARNLPMLPGEPPPPAPPPPTSPTSPSTPETPTVVKPPASPAPTPPAPTRPPPPAGAQI